MEINGAKILIDGMQLEQLNGRGIKTYSKNLIKAYKALGANPSVLISDYPQMADIGISPDVASLLKKMSYWDYVKYVYPLLINTIRGNASNAEIIDIPKGINLPEGFSFINDASVYVSPECYNIAKRFRLLGLKLTISLKPKVDIWHTTYKMAIKIKGAVRVSTIHDINPLRSPDTSRFFKGKYSQYIKDTLKDSKLILCVSQHTKKDLIDYFNVNPDRLIVNYQPVLLTNEVIAEDEIYDRLTTFDLKYGQYILFIGLTSNKNLKRFMEAFLRLSIEIPLVIVGKPKPAQLDVEFKKAIINKRIRIFNYVSESDKYILYKSAMFLAFPSLYEGFGLPPIEAMSVGVPVLTSSVSCMPEVCGDAALYVDPYDVEDIADKITMMINDKELRKRLITKGYERAKIFSMDNFIKGLKTAYSKL